MKYDVVIIGAGPGGIFSAYELMKQNNDLKIAVFEAGNPLSKRHCPIDGDKVKTCIKCKTCAIMSGFGGAGAFSDGKYNITNDFGGTLYEHIGKKDALDLMRYVDEINVAYGGQDTKMYSTAGTKFKKLCMQNKLKLLDASVRHLGTDINYVVLENLYAKLKELCDVLGIIVEKEAEILDEDIEKLIEERQAARKAKDFARADAIRDELLEKGIILKDTREGVQWKKA